MEKTMFNEFLRFFFEYPLRVKEKQLHKKGFHHSFLYYIKINIKNR